MVSPWLFAAGQWQALPTVELSEASTRSVTWRLTGNSEASVDIDGTSAQAGQVHELITDLWVMWSGQPLFRGRFGPSSDSGDEDSLKTSFSAADYRALMQRRFLYEGDTLSYLAKDQSAIAWGLIDSTQSKPGGDLDIVRGSGTTTGVIRDRSDFQPGDSIGQALDNLSQVIDGFDYDFTPNARDASLSFDIFYPARGVERGSVLDYGGRVTGFSRTVDPSTFGNAVRATGADTVTPVSAVSSTISIDPAGRWDLQYAEQSITVAATLTGKAQATLAAGQYVLPSWSVVLAPGTWGGPTDFWLGDQVTLTVRRGRLDVTESLRVVQIDLTLDADDTEQLSVTLGAPSPALKRTARVTNQRLNALERR